MNSETTIAITAGVGVALAVGGILIAFIYSKAEEPDKPDYKLGGKKKRLSKSIRKKSTSRKGCGSRKKKLIDLIKILR
jgi:hypothetical protein